MPVLTERFVASAKSKHKAQTEFFDSACPGLSLRVTKAGKKTWAFTYTSPRDDKRARITLGINTKAFGLAEARTSANQKRVIVESGKDPRHVADEKETGKTIAELIADRMKRAVRGKLRSASEIERRYNKHVIPYKGTMLVKEFRRGDLNDLTDRCLDAEHPVLANHVFNDVRALFNFAVERDVIEYSPLAKAKRPTKDDSIKDRNLDVGEIEWFWNALPTIFPGTMRKDGGRTESDRVISILKTILATGQRPGEVCAMERGEVELHGDKPCWTIPKAKVKNNREQVVPLNDIAKAIIDAALERTNGKYVFPNDEGDGPFDTRVLAKTVKRAFEPTKTKAARMGDLEKFTPHDLRRTLATQMSLEENHLEIPENFIDHVLNHTTKTRQTVTQKHYNKNDYFPEKKIALDAWGKFLQRVIDGKVKRSRMAKAA